MPLLGVVDTPFILLQVRLDQATDYWPWTAMTSQTGHIEGARTQSNIRPNSMEHHETMWHVRRSVHQNVTRQGSQTITEPSIMCPLSVIELAGPVLIIGAY